MVGSNGTPAGEMHNWRVANRFSLLESCVVTDVLFCDPFVSHVYLLDTTKGSGTWSTLYRSRGRNLPHFPSTEFILVERNSRNPLCHFARISILRSICRGRQCVIARRVRWCRCWNRTAHIFPNFMSLPLIFFACDNTQVVETGSPWLLRFRICSFKWCYCSVDNTVRRWPSPGAICQAVSHLNRVIISQY